jgi:hypothetical protein
MYVAPVVTLLRVNSLEISAQNVVLLIGNVKTCAFRNVTCYTPECGGPENIDPRL